MMIDSYQTHCVERKILQNVEMKNLKSSWEPMVEEQCFYIWEEAEHKRIVNFQTQVNDLKAQIKNLQTMLDENLFPIIIGNSDISLERGEN